MSNNLDLSNVINVSLLGVPSGLDVVNINTLALFTDDQPSSPFASGYKLYKSASEVAEDFGSTSDTYNQAVAVFSQNPNLLNTSGYFVVIPLLAAVTIQDLIYTAKASGGEAITIAYTTGGTAGSEVVTVVGNAISVQIESGVSTATQVKAAIDGDVDAAALVDVEVVTGQESNPQTAPVTATNLVISSEGTIHAINRTKEEIFYFGILLNKTLSEADFVSLTATIQSLDKLLFYSSNLSADLEPSGIFDDVRTATKTHTRCLYYSVSADAARLMAAAYAGRTLSTNFSGSLTAQTMHLKSLATITPDTVDQTTLNKALAAGVDTYVSIAGVPSVFNSGKNLFVDQIYNRLWFKFDLQTSGFNFLRQTNTKIPQTEPGMSALKGAYQDVCDRAIVNGFAAPGSWTSPDTFGNTSDLIRNIADVGYYIYSLPVSQQSAGDRTDRKAPLVQIAIKEAGAIHSSNIIVNVNI